MANVKSLVDYFMDCDPEDQVKLVHESGQVFDLDEDPDVGWDSMLNSRVIRFEGTFEGDE